jgi:hypothetical protein
MNIYLDQESQLDTVSYLRTTEEDFALLDLGPAFRHVILDHV